MTHAYKAWLTLDFDVDREMNRLADITRAGGMPAHWPPNSMIGFYAGRLRWDRYLACPREPLERFTKPFPAFLVGSLFFGGTGVSPVMEPDRH